MGSTGQSNRGCPGQHNCSCLDIRHLKKKRGGVNSVHMHSTIPYDSGTAALSYGFVINNSDTKLIQGSFNFNQSPICCSFVKGLMSKGCSAPVASSSVRRLTESDKHSCYSLPDNFKVNKGVSQNLPTFLGVNLSCEGNIGPMETLKSYVFPGNSKCLDSHHCCVALHALFRHRWTLPAVHSSNLLIQNMSSLGFLLCLVSATLLSQAL